MVTALKRTARTRAEDISVFERHKWFLGLLIGGLVNTGVMWQQFQQVQKQLEEYKSSQTAIAIKLGEFREKQIGGLQDLEVLKQGYKNLDSRVLVIERIFIQKGEDASTQARKQ